MSCGSQELLALRGRLDSSPDFQWGSVYSLFWLTVLCFALFVFVLCLRTQRISLDFPFLIAPSVFPYVYIGQKTIASALTLNNSQYLSIKQSAKEINRGAQK